MPLLPHTDPTHVVARVTSARVLSAVFNVVVGIRLLFPDDTLASSAGYSLARQHFANDVIFGSVLIVLGLIMGAGLYSDALDRIIDGATLAGMAVWGLFAFDLTWVNPAQIGTFAYGILAVGTHVYAYVHLLSWRNQQARGIPEGRA